MKYIKVLFILIGTMGILHAEKVKVFDLNDQILETSGTKVEKFKVNDIIISTNLKLSANEDFYQGSSHYFSFEFEKPENHFEVQFRMGTGYSEHIWRFVDDMGESIYLYQSKKYILINGKRYNISNNDHIKIIVNNSKLLVYSNNKKLAMVNLSKLKGVKTVEFEGVKWLSEFLIFNYKS